MTAAPVPLVRAAGDPFTAGLAHGQARGPALRAFLDDDLCRLNRLLPAPVAMESLTRELAQYSAAIADAAPRLSEEIDGLARGAGLTRAEAVLLQARREILGYQRIPTRGDCTTYASLTAGPGATPVLAQTVDLNGDLDDQLAVLDVELTGSARRALVLSFGGQLGYLGLNSDGLAIGLNLVLGGEWGPGLPPYLAIRHLLDSASDVPGALDILRELPLASSRSLLLCDTERIACAEICDGEVVEVPVQVHTNHFLHPGFAARDELNIFARNSSQLRLTAGQERLTGLPAGGADAEDHFALLAQPPVCVASTGDIRRERTVAAVVLLPVAGQLHVRPGDPSRSATTSFSFPRAGTAAAGLARSQ
jgi:isopenicillin-N N-acyltransferase-like protein